MIKYVILFIFILPQIAFSATTLNLEFNKGAIKQGSLESARILLKADAVQRVPVQKLKGQTLSNTIYIYDVSPLVRKNGSDFFETNAKVIFVKVPETNALASKLGSEDLLITWGDIPVSPTEGAKGFVFGNFEIPSRPKILLWLSILVGIAVLSVVGFWCRKKYQLKSSLKKKKQALKSELISASSYQDVVEVWKKKHLFLSEFPQIEEAFRTFEGILFKYQFKPRQSEAEVSVVIEAYRDFVRKIEGGLNGV